MADDQTAGAEWLMITELEYLKYVSGMICLT